MEMTKISWFLIILCFITSIITKETVISTEDQLIIEEDSPHTYEQVETNLIKYLKDKLIQFHTTISSYGDNVATTKGIQKISSEFEILVFGPARVGKSTLIQQISGDETIETSAQLNPCTKISKKYIDKYNINWWDTPGFEHWTVEDAKHFFKESFYDRQILPKVAIFCRTANSLGSTKVIQYMFNELQERGILLLFVITKWPFIPKSEQNELIREAVSLLGGQSKPIYRKSTKGYRAYECQPNKSYIIPVNSKEDEVLGIHVGIGNINILRKILITKLDAESQGKLINLYKDNLGFRTKLGYSTIEILDDVGIDVSKIALTEEENNIYKKLKDGDNLGKVAIPILKTIIDKVLPPP